MVQLFTRNPCSWLIYPIEICVPLYAERSHFKEFFENIKELVVNKVFEHVDSFDKIKADPLIATDMLGLVKRYLKVCPEMIFCGPSFSNLLDFSIICCQVEHQELNKSLTEFQMKLFITLMKIQTGKLRLPVTNEEAKQIGEFAFEKGAIIFEKYMQVSNFLII